MCGQPQPVVYPTCLGIEKNGTHQLYKIIITHFLLGAKSMNTTAVKSAAVTTQVRCEPVKLLRRIGSATVEVTVHFSDSSKDTMADIVHRLIEREVDKIA